VQYAFGDGSGSLATGDLNGDGAVDLVVSNFYSNTESVLLNSGGTHMQVTSSPNPSTLGQSVTFTATVLPTFSSVGNPSGVVAFMDGVVELGTVPLASGQASFTTTSLTEGDHNIRVLYSGDKLFNRNKRHLSQTVMP
jgi:hypothetical protein